MENISFWEKKWFTNYEYVVIGAGIVGCFAALKIANEKKNAKVALIENYFTIGGKYKCWFCFGSMQVEKNRKEMSDDDLLSLLDKLKV